MRKLKNCTLGSKQEPILDQNIILKLATELKCSDEMAWKKKVKNTGHKVRWEYLLSWGKMALEKIKNSMAKYTEAKQFFTIYDINQWKTGVKIHKVKLREMSIFYTWIFTVFPMVFYPKTYSLHPGYFPNVFLIGYSTLSQRPIFLSINARITNMFPRVLCLSRLGNHAQTDLLFYT